MAEATGAPDTHSRLRIAALADVHYARQSQALLVPLLDQIGQEADVMLLCGDLTHHGLAEEAVALTKDLSHVSVPMVAVLGNHDHHADQQDEIRRVLTDARVHVLDGDAVEIRGVGFAGVKGFIGGFGRYILEPWGEAMLRQLVREAVEESLRLESALARIHAATRVAVLHYAPIGETVRGEPAEIQPFLGSSRLEEPLNRFQVAAAFHGHAHHGTPEGRTSAGIPVYNVSMPLLKRSFPDRPPFRLIEIEVVQPAVAPSPDGAP
jgi:Icc-related predicted phosphoesterase